MAKRIMGFKGGLLGVEIPNPVSMAFRIAKPKRRRKKGWF